ncbi:MAG: beta-ketoacyl-ACP synthase III [bacterium]|nr:beta-ketoacyl-ACP synthase III [bacterium]
MTGRIAGTGSYIPSQVLSNEDLSKIVDTSDQWIRERTGVLRRHIVKQDTTVSMAVKSAEAAILDAHINPEELDMIIVSTISSNLLMPCTACEVQKKIGAVNAACFDLNAACSGFLVAYSTVLGYIEMGIVKKALIIGSECMSKLLDWSDRSTCILFGDGAGAVVIEAADGEKGAVVLHSDGEKGNALCLETHGKITMNGQEVFRFAVSNVPKVIEELLHKMGKQREEIDAYILHQANQRILDAIAKRLGVDKKYFPSNIREYANTSSASIPILLDELKKNGDIDKGQQLILAGFGGGLTWGAAYIRI